MDRHTQKQLQDIVTCAFENIIRELALHDGPPSIDKLRRLVEFKRGKRLIHDQLPLRGGLTAFCIALSDVDLIRTCIDAEDPLRETSYIHECVHLIANDLPTVSLDMPYSAFLTLPRNHLSILYRQQVTCCRSLDTQEYRGSVFDSPREFISEKVAALLFDYFEQYKSSVPRSVIAIYGYHS